METAQRMVDEYWRQKKKTPLKGRAELIITQACRQQMMSLQVLYPTPLKKSNSTSENSDRKNKSTTSSERNALIAKGYRSNASNSRISQGDNTVNNNSMQKDSKNSLRDNEYLEAVNNRDMETAQRMVD